MKERAFIFLRRHTTPKTRENLKAKLLKLRRKFSWLYLLRYGTFTVEELRDEIKGKIGDDYEILMVHTSFDYLLPMFKGTPYDLLKMLLSLTSEKTLAMPAFTFGGSSSELISYFEKKPYFYRDKSPAQTGLVNELFRRHPGVKRSLHPTISVCAFGPLAEELTASHHKSQTNMGQGTPFGVMDSRQTVILGLGIYYFRNLTHVHTVESLMGERFPYPARREFKEINVTLVDGKERFKYVLREETGKPIERDLSLLGKIMDISDLLQWKFKGVPLFYAKADKVTEALAQAAEKGLTIYNYGRAATFP
jgi:aminoglycoside 3-N-acetyltransferase